MTDVTSAPHDGRIRLLPEARNAPMIRPRLLIYHSIVGSSEGAYQYFLHSSVLESHFIVTWSGELWQLMPTDRQADANYRANPFAVSVETEDHGDPDHQPWTEAQLDTLVWLAWEMHREYGIPLRRADRWDGSGVGYHSQYRPWSPVVKTCPGAARIAQFNTTILPRLTQQEDPLSSSDVQQIKEYTKQLSLDTRDFAKEVVLDAERRLTTRLDTLEELVRAVIPDTPPPDEAA